MQGLTHLFATAVYLAAAAFAFFKMGYISFFDSILFLIASLLGVLLPDVDAPKSLATKIHLRKPFKYVAYTVRLIAYITKLFLFSFLRLFLFILGKKGRKHRGILHSFKGLLSVSTFWLVLGYFALDYLNLMHHFQSLLMLMIGLIAGYSMHLWHDSLTVSGLQLSDKIKVRGWLKTGRHEWSLQLFFLLISSFSAHITNTVSPIIGLIILITALPATFLLFIR